jgi:hypothetical protein
MRSVLWSLKNISAVRRLAYRVQLRRGVSGQSDEGQILSALAKRLNAPKTFVEFGFHPIQFNCAALMSDFRGLLIDGNTKQVEDARAIFPPNLRVEHHFLDLTNLNVVRSAFSELGVLSIDVDGNDYWFLEQLIDLAPAVIVVEYNASFLHESVSVPYDRIFDRAAKHASGWYHGASLVALAKLCSTHGYGLAAVADAGGNAFFTKDGKLDPLDAWKPSRLRDKWSGTSAEDQWETVRHLPLVQV